MEEIWKPIKNYESLYEVSNLGNVRSISSRWGKRNSPRKVKLITTPANYIRVSLSKNNKSKLYMVHRLVYETFVGEIPENYEINHKDFIRNNNCIDNLEIMTHLENTRYSKAIKVRQYDLDSRLIKIWNCIRQIEKETGIDHRQICDNLKGKQKTCHNYIFKYEEV